MIHRHAAAMAVFMVVVEVERVTMVDLTAELVLKVLL
jgi:hypothetical protein